MLFDLVLKSKYLYPALKSAYDFAKKLLYLALRIFNNVEDKTILFESFQGRNISCSPKALYLCALSDKEYDEFSFVWALRDCDKEILDNERTVSVKYGSLSYMKALSKAKYIITNSTMPSFFTPKKEQTLIQNWHGTPLKKLGCDIEKNEDKAQKLSSIHKQYKEQGKKASVFISPSQFYTEKIATAFAQKQNKDKFLPLGYPRNDFLFSYTDADVKRVKQALNIPNDKKVILYAPTFRDNNYERGHGFHYDCEIDFDLLYKALSKDYVILFRAHYFVIDRYNLEKYKGFVIDASRYQDINDLYIVSDMLITDYSSVFFDYANLKRPIVFYMYDYERYKNKMRDFYLDINKLPGKISYTNEELLNLIFDAEKREFDFTEFNEKYNTYCDAHSSQRVLKYLIKNRRKV